MSPREGNSSPPAPGVPQDRVEKEGRLNVVQLRNGVVIIGLEPVLRHRIWAVEEDLREILAGPRVPDLEVSLGGRFEIHIFRLRGECLEASGKRFRIWCRDLADYLRPDVISTASLELERFMQGIPEAEPSKVKVWIERLEQLDSELSRIDEELPKLIVGGVRGEAEQEFRKPLVLCLDGPIGDSNGLAPLPTHSFLCAQKLESVFNIKKWLGDLYILRNGQWIGEPDSIYTLQSIMKATFEKFELHRFNWKYSTFEREVLRILYAGAPVAEPVRGVRSGGYIILWGESNYEIKQYNGEFVIYDINARVKPELLRLAKAKSFNAGELALAEAPQLVEILKSWVGEPYWLTLLELIGYATVAFKYPLNKAFMLLGRGSNGKSMYLRMLRDILGGHNVTSIPLQAFSNMDYRFLWAGLIGKLANIFADIPRSPLTYTGVFKVLTGEDCIDIDRKGKDPVRCYTNYAKLVFSANELPETKDFTYAFFRRWVLIYFPHVFPEDPTWYDRNVKPELRDIALTVGLEAMKEVLERRAFTSEADVRERWLEESDVVFKFIRNLERLNLARREPNGRVGDRELYRIYVKWTESQGVGVLAKAEFTKRLEMYGIVKGSKPYYTGIMLLERPDIIISKLETLGEESREGLEAYQ